MADYPCLNAAVKYLYNVAKEESGIAFSIARSNWETARDHLKAILPKEDFEALECSRMRLETGENLLDDS